MRRSSASVSSTLENSPLFIAAESSAMVLVCMRTSGGGRRDCVYSITLGTRYNPASTNGAIDWKRSR